VPLVQLRWKGEEGDWHEQSDRLAVRRGVRGARIYVQNQGPVPAGLVLLRDGLVDLPPWVLREQLQERAITIPPGGQEEIEVPFVARALERLFRATSHRAEPQGLQAEAVLRFHTTLCRRSDAGWTPKGLAITLQVAREPWFSPAGSSYRFLPLEALTSGEFVHELELYNEHAEPIEILGIEVLEGAELALPPASFATEPVRLRAEQLARLRSDGVPRVLKPGTHSPLRLQLQLKPDALPEGRAGWFSLLLECRYRHHRQARMHALIEGVVGRAPTLELLDEPSVEHPSLDQPESFPLRLRNPGDIPVRVTGIHVLRPDGQAPPADQPDWFRLHGLREGEVLDPGERRVLHYELRPDERPFDELDAEWCSRRVRLEHDGWGSASERVLEVEIGAQLGKVRVATGVYLGIDFGTSNSMVCLVRSDGQVQVALQLDADAQSREQLPSLMYYRGEPEHDPEGDPFLYGSEADAYAGVNPSNLVRSIKSVIAQHPDTRYHFLDEDSQGRVRRRTFQPQELLDLFITELRRRAERAVSNLSVRQLRSLQLDSGKVRFVQAIFSHPVEVSAEMKQALMQAAHAAGLYAELRSPQAFVTESCVDEATAAVLAYVYGRISGDVARDALHRDLERVLCFDVGGGTTDVAAVEIKDLARFLAGEVDCIEVTLEVTAGDALFGGDDLDELVAGWVLTSIQEQSLLQGAPIDKREIERAVGFRSFAEYYNGFKARRRQRRSRPSADEERSLEQARAIYNRAMEVLRKAEEAKCALSSTSSYELNFSGEGWPRRGRVKDLDNFKVDLQRQRLETAVREQARKQTALLERVRSNAGWDWPSVTTMLFTGQGTRVPAIREELLSYVDTQRGAGAQPLIVVQPDDGSGFDPKRCVAQGAAIWGTRQDARWIVVHNRMAELLTFNLQRPHGPFRFKTVPGLERGTPLPTEATLSFPGPRSSLELFKDRKLHVVFSFPAATEVVVRVEGPGQFTLRVGDAVMRGELVQ